MLSTVNKQGNCPYCDSNNYDSTQEAERNPLQLVKYCMDCDRFSVTQRRNKAQYPLQDPTDNESLPTTSVEV